MEYDKAPWRYTISKIYGRRQISHSGGRQICMMWNGKNVDGNARIVMHSPEMYEYIKMRAAGGDIAALQIAESILTMKLPEKI